MHDLGIKLPALIIRTERRRREERAHLKRGKDMVMWLLGTPMASVENSAIPLSRSDNHSIKCAREKAFSWYQLTIRHRQDCGFTEVKAPNYPSHSLRMIFMLERWRKTIMISPSSSSLPLRLACSPGMQGESVFARRAIAAGQLSSVQNTPH